MNSEVMQQHDSEITFTRISELLPGNVVGGMIGVAIHFKRGQEQWRTELLSAAECAELLLGSGIFPPEKAGRIIRQISDLGEVREDICMTDEQARALKLTRF